jgi:hypothetical protein
MLFLQDLLLAFVDCVERNGAKLAQPRTVLEMDQESLLPRLMTGLLPAPGGSSGSELGLSMMSYGGRNGSGGGGMPITVQVVDSVEVTAVPVGSSSSSGGGGSSGGSSNGAAAGGKEGAAAAAAKSGKGGSSGGGGGSSGGGGGSSGGSSSRPGSAGGSGSAAAEQQQQQLQPMAAAAAAGGVAYAAAGGARLDAAGMAAGSNAQRKGERMASGLVIFCLNLVMIGHAAGDLLHHQTAHCIPHSSSICSCTIWSVKRWQLCNSCEDSVHISITQQMGAIASNKSTHISASKLRESSTQTQTQKRAQTSSQELARC